MLVAELAGQDQGPAAALHATGSRPLPADHQHRLGRRAAGHLRPRARPQLRQQPLLLRLLHARVAQPRPRLALHRQRRAHRDGARQRVRPLRGPAERRRGAPRRRARTSTTTASSCSRPASTSCRRSSQQLTSPRGKVHRINPDGTIPTDNPFYDGSGPNVDSIWARGLRNPYRAYYDPPTGRYFIGDVGGNDASTADRGGRPRRRGRELRLAEQRGPVLGALPEPAVLLPAQRSRLRDHRRLRLPRLAVPELVRRRLLLRRLHPELDQGPDARRQRQRHRHASTSSRPTAASTARTATSSTWPRDRTAPSTTSISGTPTSAAPSA